MVFIRCLVGSKVGIWVGCSTGCGLGAVVTNSIQVISNKVGLQCVSGSFLVGISISNMHDMNNSDALGLGLGLTVISMGSVRGLTGVLGRSSNLFLVTYQLCFSITVVRSLVISFRLRPLGSSSSCSNLLLVNGLILVYRMVSVLVFMCPLVDLVWSYVVVW